MDKIAINLAMVSKLSPAGLQRLGGLTGGIGTQIVGDAGAGALKGLGRQLGVLKQPPIGGLQAATEFKAGLNRPGLPIDYKNKALSDIRTSMRRDARDSLSAAPGRMLRRKPMSEDVYNQKLMNHNPNRSGKPYLPGGSYEGLNQAESNIASGVPYYSNLPKNGSYVQGFIDKCAELGIDAEKLAQAVSGENEGVLSKAERAAAGKEIQAAGKKKTYTDDQIAGNWETARTTAAINRMAAKPAK